MRRKLKVKAEHKELEKRTVERYAWFPKTLDDNYRVWLEKYYVRQTYYIWDRRGRWVDTQSWSISTEQSKMLKNIKGE